MTHAGVVVGSLLMCLGPLCLFQVMLLMRHPQLALVSLVGSGMWFLLPVLSTSIWYTLLGGHDAEPNNTVSSQDIFLAVFLSTVCELGRFALAVKIVAIEAIFSQRRQSLIHVKIERRWGTSDPSLVPLGLTIGCGVATMHALLSVGSVANADIMLTWIVPGTSWMNPESSVFTWYDVESCPTFPKIFWLAVQSLFFSACHFGWSVVAVIAAAAHHRNRSRMRGTLPLPVREVPLPVREDESVIEGIEGVEMSSRSHAESVGLSSNSTQLSTNALRGEIRSPAQRRENASHGHRWWTSPPVNATSWRPHHVAFAVFSSLLLHVFVRLSSLIAVHRPAVLFQSLSSAQGSVAIVDGSEWGGCGGALGAQALCACVAVVASIAVVRSC